MHVLVTGAAGFIGFHLSKRLLAEGHTVVGLDSLNDYYSVQLKKDRLSQLLPLSGFTFEHADLADDAALEAAETLLFMPDLLGYFLTGEKKSEYTETTTSMLYNPIKRDWYRDIMAAFGLPGFPHLDLGDDRDLLLGQAHPPEG